MSYDEDDDYCSVCGTVTSEGCECCQDCQSQTCECCYICGRDCEICDNCDVAECQCKCCEDCCTDPCKCDLNDTKLDQVFTTLESAGWIAKQNFLCCSTCAYSSITDIVDNRLRETVSPEIKGCVYYHNQDTQRVREYGKLYLRYGSIETNLRGEVGMPAQKCGEEICKILTEYGLNWKWSGDSGDCIEVKVTC